jgi:hypothetical protein
MGGELKLPAFFETKPRPTESLKEGRHSDVCLLCTAGGLTRVLSALKDMAAAFKNG